MAQSSEPVPSIATLYVGDLKTEVGDDFLWNLFCAYGHILSVKVCRDSTTGDSLGYGYVNFRSIEEAEKAMNALNFSPIDGKPCRIMWSMRDPHKRRNNNGNLFLKNIDASVDSRALYEAFSVFGPILSCKLATDELGNSKGYGFIHFFNEQDALMAIEKANGVEFLNKKIMVTPFVPRSERYLDAKDGKIKFTNVFCKNFGEEWSTEDLKKIFGKFGNITSAVVMCDSNGRSKGFGFVNFENPDDAEKAVNESTNLKTESGSVVYVAKALKKYERLEQLKKEYNRWRLENVKKHQDLNVYIKSLEPTMTDDKLKELFAKFGTILSHKIMRDKTGRSRGFGFVCFSKPEEAQNAIKEMNGATIDSKPLLVTIAQLKEERRRELAINHAKMQSQMFTASVPLVYGQNFPGYQFPMAPRFSHGQAGSRGFPRSVPPPTQYIPQGHSRSQGFHGYNVQSVPYIPRNTRGQQNGNFVSQRQNFVHYQNKQNHQQVAYISPPQDGTMMKQPTISQPLYGLNYISVEPGDVSKTDSGASKKQREQSKSIIPSQDHLKTFGGHVYEASKEVFPELADEALIKLTNTVVDSVKNSDFRLFVANRTALLDLIRKAHSFIIQGEPPAALDGEISSQT